MVINIGQLLDQDYEAVLNDIQAVVRSLSAFSHQPALKVILETAMLSKEQIIDGCILSVIAGAQFVKTCTGFGGGKATVEDVHLMKMVVGSQNRVKASGGIKTKKDAEDLIQAGADRLGTSSGVAIVSDRESTSGY
eukprot:TRINITY_DN1889_c0_g1_i2.p1 TRINITY_DN1889_c0_g1~~TRINITY_DN1889_c0_g1_i2.p1  ORF type:complete len:136 (-),score=38.82 TRINITY_DN1889_c0_g1_i2:37-444(-)